MLRTATILGLAAGLLAPAAAPAQDPEAQKLALAARGVLEQHCYRCHAGSGSPGGKFDILKHEDLITPRAAGKAPLVAPGKADGAASKLVARVFDDQDMPPEEVKQRPTAAELDVLKKWIAAGAPPFPKGEDRKYIDNVAVLNAVGAYLQKAKPEDRRSLQFFTITHLHNNPAVPGDQLQSTRAALSKAINSMHWESDVVVPKPLDNTSDTVFVLDLRRVGWTHCFHEVRKAYPYYLRYDECSNRDEVQADNLIAGLCGLGRGDPLPLMRADWFVSVATRPPLYHYLADIPTHATVLEKRLGVNVIDNFYQDRLARAGFAASGVSRQNRLVERHPAQTGAYWKSYDFLPPDGAKGRRTLLPKFPLGPEFSKHPYPDQAFEHDGGEMVFNLPNGMQGYMLVNGKDERIDAGPIAVVGDDKKTSGTSEIVNGLSCMACHKSGMIRFTDTVRNGAAVFGAARQKVDNLYPDAERMAGYLDKDEKKFLGALDEAVGPFLRVGADKDKPVKDFKEPVFIVAQRYRLADVDLAAAAYELDMPKPDRLAGMIEGNRLLQSMGLAPLTLKDGKIKREDWEKSERRSLLQRTAGELGRGRAILLR